MLKLAGETDIGLEKIEHIFYCPDEPLTPDLESGTHTIVPTARPAIANAQYSYALTLPKPDDARVEILRVAARLSVNIAGLGTATHVYCSVRVDVDDADHELFSEDWTSTGAKLAAVDTHSGALSTIFELLKDGQAHTFYFLFWADVASQATIDVVQLWENVGTCATSYVTCLRLKHTGLAGVGSYCRRTGSGTPKLQALMDSTYNPAGVHIDLSGHDSYSKEMPAILIPDHTYIWMRGTVSTDLNHFYRIRFVLRSEQ